MKKFAMIVVASAMMCACSPKSNVANNVSNPKGDGELTAEVAPSIAASEPRNVVAKASAFKMSGDYADRVAVTVGANGRLTYFPAPSDITSDSAPLALGDGWYLNRQGIGPNSVFTKWTFEEYMALGKVPTPQEILDAVIPGAMVTEFVTLPVTASEARNMTSEQLLKLLE